MTPSWFAIFSANATPRAGSLQELALVAAGIIVMWLWSVRSAGIFKKQNLTVQTVFERRRSRAAIFGYQIALLGCFLMSLSQDNMAATIFAVLTVAAPFAHAWLDPERAGFLHHRKLRGLAALLHCGFALFFGTLMPTLLPLLMAALVFHRFQRATLRRLAASLAEQDALKRRLSEQVVKTKLAQVMTSATSTTSPNQLSDLKSDKVAKAS